VGQAENLMAEFDEIEFCPACGTRIDHREAFGRVRPVCPNCGHVHFQDPKVAAAALVERDRKVLLVRRVNVPERGKWTLPAGFVDFDEDPRLAAARECKEETGLDVRVTDLVDVIYGQEHPRGASIVIVYRAEIAEGDLGAHDDADAVGFFGPDELPALAFLATRVVLERWRRGV
jgi:ADP-ribose pyrophosphatase YjhB (NUDIX family)